MLVLGVALLAGFLFIGGGAAIYLSTPPQPAQTINLIADNGTPGPSLADYTQETPGPSASPAPTPTPFFFSVDPGSLPPIPTDFSSPLPTSFLFPTPTPTPTPVQTTFGGPTPTPTAKPTPTPTPTPTGTPTPPPVTDGFSFMVSGNTVQFTDKSTGDIVSWSWDFGDGNAKTYHKDVNPSHTYPDTTMSYTVTLTVTDSAGMTWPSRSKKVVITQSTPPPPTSPPPTETPPPSGSPAS